MLFLKFISVSSIRNDLYIADGIGYIHGVLALDERAAFNGGGVKVSRGQDGSIYQKTGNIIRIQLAGFNISVHDQVSAADTDVTGFYGQLRGHITFCDSQCDLRGVLINPRTQPVCRLTDFGSDVACRLVDF